MSRYVVMAEWNDVPHLSERDKEELYNSIPAHQRDARSKGIPVLGSGLIFPVDDNVIKIPAFDIPKHWPQIGAMDFGGADHPFAAVKMAWDRDSDTIYYTQAYRIKEPKPIIHVGALKVWGESLLWAWPHDGLQTDKTSGEPLKDIYKGHGLKMLDERVTYEDGSYGVEAGLTDMLERMETGRLRVFSHLNDWFEERRMYHRKDGKVIKLMDDLMSASRYALMMKRFATCQTASFNYDELYD